MNYSRIIIGSLIIALGMSFLFNFPLLKYLLPLLIIILGLKIVLGSNHPFQTGTHENTGENFLNRVLIFSGINQQFYHDNLEGVEIIAIFGGGEIDLRSVKSKHKALKFNFVSIFGGLKIYLPSDWSVDNQGIGIIGGFTNKTKMQSKPAVKVTIEGLALFGGIDIVN